MWKKTRVNCVTSRKENMSPVPDFLEWYNKDVVPILEAMADA